jgi:hypothetical protein
MVLKNIYMCAWKLVFAAYEWTLVLYIEYFQNKLLLVATIKE